MRVRGRWRRRLESVSPQSGSSRSSRAIALKNPETRGHSRRWESSQTAPSRWANVRSLSARRPPWRHGNRLAVPTRAYMRCSTRSWCCSGRQCSGGTVYRGAPVLPSCSPPESMVSRSRIVVRPENLLSPRPFSDKKHLSLSQANWGQAMRRIKWFVISQYYREIFCVYEFSSTDSTSTHFPIISYNIYSVRGICK